MKSTIKSVRTIPPAKRQGRLLAFGMTGAMALAVSACNRSPSVMITPPGNFTMDQARYYSDTNQAPNTPYVYGTSNTTSYLGAHGFYPMYGYPGFFYRPAPGSSVQLVTGGSSSYRASSPAEASQSVARGGFGRSAGGEGGGE